MFAPDRISTFSVPLAALEKHRISALNHKPMSDGGESLQGRVDAVTHDDLDRYRGKYPEFFQLLDFKDRTAELLEHADMLKRRQKIAVPEFYVGSIMAVTSADAYAPGKRNRFVGICIEREGRGLRAAFRLRNCIDGHGVEVLYHLYNPILLSIEVLKLQKRLDDQLLYLRDAPPKYSTVPFDIEPVRLPRGVPVPVDETIVDLNERYEGWKKRWHLKTRLRGYRYKTHHEIEWQIYKVQRATPWAQFERYDLLKKYRQSREGDDRETVLTVSPKLSIEQ